MTDSFVDRSILRIARSPQIAPLALKALLRANELLGLAIGVRLAKLRDSDDRLASCFAESESNALHARLFLETADICRGGTAFRSVSGHIRARPHASLGPSVPEPFDDLPAVTSCRTALATKPVLGGLHHDYRLRREAA